MSSQKNLLLLRRLQLLKRGSSSSSKSTSSSSLTTTAARPWLAAAPTTTTLRYKSSVSPAYRQDEDDEDENDHDHDHASTVRRPSGTHFPSRILKQQAIQVQSPPLLETAPEETQQQADNTVSQDSTTASKFASPSQLQYTGDATIPVTSRLHIVKPGEDTPRGTWPVFRLMDEDGSFRDGSSDGYVHEEGVLAEMSTPTFDKSDRKSALDELRETLCSTYPLHAAEFERSRLLQPAQFSYDDIESQDTLARAHRQIVRLREMDTILQNAQRQGRISFYMTCRGEEAIHLGTASALELSDVILAQYREQGLLMWRGFTLQQFTDQCFSNKADLGKGRQMPVHYGSRALNYQTISSPLGTQIPQAAGAAYRLKLAGKDAISVCFFGEGCTSTTDFHSGLNFAATLNCPVVFVCRNNGYAISTSVKDQYSGDGVVSRAPGYGMAGIRVDGNDIFAMHAAIREARAYALEHHAPVLVEAMSYRQGHHSTSDDSLRYRSVEEVERFAQECDPLDRLQNFMKRHEYEGMSDESFRAATDEEKMAVLDAMRKAERKPKPSLDELFEDVYHEMPASLRAQQEQLHAHIAKYPNHY